MLRPRDLCQSSGTRTFLEAMHGGKVHLARFVLDALDSKIVNSRAEEGRTPLMFAACLPDPALSLKFARLLLEKGAGVNEEDERGRTALSLACELGHLELVKLLVQFNADPEIPDRGGNSALMYAASGGHSAVLEFLLKAFKRLGLRVERTNHAGQSALQVASVRGHSECVRALSSQGVLRRSQRGGEAAPEAAPSGHSPKPLPRQVLERFARQFQPQRKSERGAPKARGPGENIRRRARLLSRESGEPEQWSDAGKQKQQQQPHRSLNAWIFTRSSSCSPGRGADGAAAESEAGRRSRLLPARAWQQRSLQEPLSGRAAPCEEPSPPGRALESRSRALSKSYEILPRTESGGAPARAQPRSPGGSRLLRSVTSPEFQGLPREEATRSQHLLSRGRGQPLIL
ncbi:ankyrin repeat domain-containing protein 63 [Rhinatrema bivittatum]|uniref:ankyrin repeat domain-containing protein 63 n=1 Tax=Rhinatrema bivittatum TaxID=194408 RepID=UPI001127A57A|nr:ankyrin repeat domain-containing protein 63 [Rhinatrema bivittatum]